MADLDIRQYRSPDAEGVWTLHVSALEDTGAYSEEFEHLDADLREIESRYFDVGGEFLVGTLEGDLVAMGAFQPVAEAGTLAERHREIATGRPAVLRRMRVEPSHQRRGFGSAIHDELEMRAIDDGFDEFTLDTTPAQTAAIEFYEERGYDRRGAKAFEGHEVLFYGKEIA